ncbi:unnamed protein product, partial [Rotaria socialis]
VWAAPYDFENDSDEAMQRLSQRLLLRKVTSKPYCSDRGSFCNTRPCCAGSTCRPRYWGGFSFCE